MSRKKKRNLPVLEQVEITGFAAEGKALARVGNKVLFVPFAAPGDVADVQVTKSRKNYMEGRLIAVHKRSPERITPFCAHFGICGGCKWQHLPYDKQLAYKQQQVTDNLERLAGVDLSGTEMLPVAGSDKTLFYRNKLEYTFSNRRWLSKDEIDTSVEIKQTDALGFHIPGLFDKVLDIEKCWLQADPSNEVRLAVRQYAKEAGMTFYDLRANEGFLRNLIIRNTPDGELMLVMVFGQELPAEIEKMMEFLKRRFPEAVSIAYMINEKANSSIADLEPVIYAGIPYLTEKMENLIFRVGPKSFFQTNSEQAGRLYSIVRSFAGLCGDEVVYDLYTGAGTIACFLSGGAKKIVGIEYVDEAVEHARHNARLNGLDNLVFLAGDMVKVFTEDLMNAHGRPDVIITDPPRAGMHPGVVKNILESGAHRIVYVSCNPATQARDLGMMKEKYRPVKSQPVDMFPHTQHVENVLLLIRQ
ncbi:MAG: 23S rRNA (uracil(1939)-C(5))-methyltransferase RlmD [Bacteroidia bacterium]|nr:MAG: 23S rRNA (uracil(1939)-C(5))-methyltransferase RlmD [Bacteroidia bacterium]